MKKRYSLEYNKTKECKILIFGDDFKFLSFFKMKHWIYKEFAKFKKIIFIQQWLFFLNWCIGEHLNITTNYKTFHSKIHLHVKLFLGKETCSFFSKVIPLAPSYRFWPPCERNHAHISRISFLVNCWISPQLHMHKTNQGMLLSLSYMELVGQLAKRLTSP